MITTIDHIGIAVESLDSAVAFYERTLGLKCDSREEIPSQQVRVALFQVGEARIELIEPSGTESPIHAFLLKHGEGIHHLAFASNDLTGQLVQAREAGCQLVNESVVTGGAGKAVAFLHPKSAHGVLIELCQG